MVFPAALLFLLRDGVQAGDTRPVVPSAARLIAHGDWDIGPFARACVERGHPVSETGLPYFVRRHGPHVYSDYPAGMAVFALPAVALARLFGADLDSLDVLMALERRTAACVSACCLGLFFLLALRVVRPATALVGCLLLAVGSAMNTTIGQALWQHGGVVFWSLLLLLVEAEFEDRPWACAVQGLAAGMMLACRLSSALLLVPFGAWLLARSPRRALHFAGWAALAWLPWAVFYWRLYGTPLGPSAGQLSGQCWASGPAEWAGVLFSPGRGLFVYQPWLVLAPFGLLPGWGETKGRPGLPAGWSWYCATAIALHLALVSSWRCWWGGHCWGSRLASDVIPLAALLCLAPLDALLERPWGRGFVVGLVLLSALFHLPSLYLRSGRWNGTNDVDHNPAALWSWSNPPFLYPMLK